MNRPPTVVVGLGELLWDCFPDRKLPGGAPANVAFHAGQLGLRGVICSRVGEDDLGREMLRFVDDHGLTTDFVQLDPRHATGRVDIVTDAEGEPRYTFADDVAWDHLEFDEAWRGLAGEVGAVCFGTLAQRSEPSRQAIHQFLAAAPAHALKVYDVNLRKPWYEAAWIERSLHAADVVKLNGDEVVLLSKLLGLSSADPADLAETLRRRFNVGLLCITRGKNGCLLINAFDSIEEEGVPVADAHPVGAGDSFTASLIFAQLRKWPLDRCAAFANQVAAKVASKPGAMPQLSDEFAQLVDRFA
ncbi:MAG: carbohydrate kinase [Pirellulaceae bacterium]